MAEPARRKTLLQAHRGEPLAVGPDLGAIGVEDAEGLLAVGRRRCARCRPRRASAAWSCGREGSPTRAVQSPMMSTARWPASWNSRSLPSTTVCPRWMSGAVGSTPSFTRSGRPRASLRLELARAAGSRPTRAARRAASALTRGRREGPREVAASRRIPKRQGRSAARVMPMRGPLTTSTGPSGAAEHGDAAPGSTAEVAVEAPVDPEGRAEAPRAGAQEPVGAAAAARAHGRRGRAVGRQGAQEHRRPAALRLADQVDAPVEAVAAVDVEVAGRAEHDRRAAARAAEAVRGGVVLLVALGLDDHAADPVDQEECSRSGRARPRRPARAKKSRARGAARDGGRPAAGAALTTRPPRARASSSCVERPPRGRSRPGAPWPRPRPRRSASGRSTPSRPAAASVARRSRPPGPRPRSRQARTSRPTASWARRKGQPSRTRWSARSVAARNPPDAAAAIRSARKRAVAIIPAIAGSRSRSTVSIGVEQVLLVLLQVLVVGQRQPGQHPQQARQVGRAGAAPWPARARRRRGSSSGAASRSPR